MLASRTARERTEKYPVAEVATGIIRSTDTKKQQRKQRNEKQGSDAAISLPSEQRIRRQNHSVMVIDKDYILSFIINVMAL